MESLVDVSPNHKPYKSDSAYDTWGILFLASIFFLSYNGRSVTGPLLPSLELDLGLNHTESAGLFIYLFLGFVVSLLGSSFVSSLIGHRRTIVLSAVAVGLTLMAVAASRSMWTLCIGLIATGLASGLYIPSGIPALTKLAKPAHWGRAIGIHDMAPNLSIVAAPALAAILLHWMSWRGVYFAFGIIAVLVGLAFIRFGPQVPGRGQTPDPITLKSLLGESQLWIICILFSVGSAGLIGIYNMLPLYLTTVHRFDPSSANLIVALSRVPGIGMVLIAGWSVDRVGPRKAIAVSLACSGALAVMIGMESGAPLMAAIFLQAVAAACFFPAALAAISLLFPFELRSPVTAMAAVFSNLVGSGLISALMGLMADYGMFRTGVVLNGVIVLAGLPALFFLKVGRNAEF
jgi:NNP family nitrate/nitrite transporter-like MFS transporter